MIAAAFLAAALFDLFSWLPGWLHVVALAGFVVAVLAVLLINLQRVHFPRYWESRRRLERVNELLHRPLEALDDHVAGGAEASPVTRAMCAAIKSSCAAVLES